MFRFATLFAVITLSLGCPGPTPTPDAGPACPALNGTTVTHSTDITADETWAGDGALHKVTFGITVRPGATLTLDACARVQIAAGLSITVAGDVAGARPAKLLSKGTASQRVHIERVDGAAGWTDLRALSPQSLIDLSYTTLSGGGAGNSAGHPMIFMRGAGGYTELSKNLRLVGVELDDSVGMAIRLEAGAALTDDSADLLITRCGANGEGVIELNTLALNSLPRSTTLRDNLLTEIKVKDGSLFLERDVTVKNLGASYHFVFDRVRVYSPTATPTLTIEPGLTLRFDDYLRVGFDNVGLNVFQPGRLIAVGTPGAGQITFTSAKPGSWPGIFLENAPGSRLEHVIIEKAGGNNGISSSNCKPDMTSDAAALFIGWPGVGYVPSASDFSNVTIRDSASHGINAMWTSAAFGPDLTAGFSFSSISGCKQTKNGRPTGCGTEAGCLVP